MRKNITNHIKSIITENKAFDDNYWTLKAAKNTLIKLANDEGN